jgi:hypothetical protein
LALSRSSHTGGGSRTGRSASRAESNAVRLGRIRLSGAYSAPTRDGRIGHGAPAIPTRLLGPGFRGSIDATEPIHSCARASGGRKIGLVADSTVRGAEPTTEPGCLHSADPAVHAATQNLRMNRQRRYQHGTERGAREKMIPLHGRLLSRPRPFRDLSKEYYEWGATNLPSQFEICFLT